MTAWTTISNALVAVGAKPFATTVQALRDNVAAGLEGATNSPVTAAGWHPYNKVLNGDTNTGLIYNFAVSGVVADIVTPNFVDGYEYRIRWESFSSSGSGSGVLSLFLETGAVYGSNLNIFTVSTSQSVSGFVELPHVRRSLVAQPIIGFNVRDEASGMITGTPINSGCVQAAQKRTRAKIAIPTPDAGRFYLDKRLAVY